MLHVGGHQLLQHCLQALDWLHYVGRAHCDLKLSNMKVRLTPDKTTFEHVTVLDLGGSVKYRGETAFKRPSAARKQSTVAL